MTSGTATRRNARPNPPRRGPGHRRTRIWWIAGLVVAMVAIALGLLTSRGSTETVAGEAAPGFTLATTAGTTVTLESLRGQPVLLYFNEGAGCGSCTQQMAEIENDQAFTDQGIRVLPIVMNSAPQITPDLQRFGVTTPYLLDDGTTSKAYGTLGTGMHAGLPGHGFVLVDATGTIRWRGDYPSMWIAPDDLLAQLQPYL